MTIVSRNVRAVMMAKFNVLALPVMTLPCARFETVYGTVTANKDFSVTESPAREVLLFFKHLWTKVHFRSKYS